MEDDDEVDVLGDFCLNLEYVQAFVCLLFVLTDIWSQDGFEPIRCRGVSYTEFGIIGRLHATSLASWKFTSKFLFNVFYIWIQQDLLFSQVWNMPMMDHANEDKNKTLNWENMLHEEKKHFSNSLPMANPPSTTTSAVVASKVSPIWTKDDVASLRKGIVSVGVVTDYGRTV